MPLAFRALLSRRQEAGGLALRCLARKAVLLSARSPHSPSADYLGVETGGTTLSTT